MARLTGLSTNGKLLKRHEAVDFLLETGAHVTLSYDGPGQHYRGEDVLKNAAVAVAVDRLLHAGQLVFSPTITNENFSLKEYIEWTQRYLSKQVLVGRLNMLQVSDAETMALAIPEDLLQAFSVKLAEEAFAVYGAQYSDGAVESFTRKLGRSGAFSCIAMSPGSMAITAGGASLACHNFPDPPAELMARHRVTPAKCGECPMLRFCHMGCPMRVLNEYDDYNCKAQYAWAFHLWVLGYNKTFGRNLERFLENDDAE